VSVVSRWRRWSAPLIAAVGIAAVTIAPSALAAPDHPKLATKTAAQLLAAVEQSRVEALSGTIKTAANLGLPQLPDRIASAGSGLQALLTGTHKLRVWADGQQHQRIALLGDLAETDVIHNGHDVWTYTSSSNTVTHRTVSAATGRIGDPTTDGAAGAGPEQQLTPQAQADQALKAIDPTTRVTVDRTARVAGRPAYQIVLSPRSPDTLVQSVRIAIDAATSVPLRVQIYARGAASPAWQTGFTNISFTTPAASIFRFTVPAGATLATATSATARTDKKAGQPTAVGDGWATIAELPAGTLDQTGNAAGSQPGQQGSSLTGMLDRVTTAIPQGRLLTTRLLSAVIAPDGRVFVGAVPAAVVEQAAAAAGA
jgi:outer membrane lipoprotein-sorting protein